MLLFVALLDSLRINSAFGGIGAGSGSRTHKSLRTLDFKSRSFANFDIPAKLLIIFKIACFRMLFYFLRRSSARKGASCGPAQPFGCYSIPYIGATLKGCASLNFHTMLLNDLNRYLYFIYNKGFVWY